MGMNNSDFKGEKQNFEIARLQFTDLLGKMKCVEIPAEKYEKAKSQGVPFDGASVDGKHRELYLWPVEDKLKGIPWEGMGDSTGSVICQIREKDETAFAGDPRELLERMVKEAEKMELRLYTEAECQFFLFHTDEEARPTTTTHEAAGYLDAGPIDLAGSVRRDMVLGLENMEIPVKAAHHQSAPGQHQIDLERQEGVTAADNIMNFRMAVSSIAKRRGLHASFMPKPKSGEHGSGLQLRLILTDLNNEIIGGETESGRRADDFAAGIRQRVREMALITNPSVNSYKRLLSDGFYQCPDLVSVQKTGSNTVIQIQYPDGTANPYLVLAAVLAAGLEGVSENLFTSASASVSKLPKDLGEAVAAFKGSEFMKNKLGSAIYDSYLEMQNQQWEEFCAAVTEWEISKFL